MIDFGGWEMPLQYTGIADEHVNVRKRVGIFDVSHMGDIVIRGKGALALVSRMITNDPAGMPIGKGIYGHILDDAGKIIDDTIVYRISDQAYLMVPNASTTGAVFEWVSRHRTDQDVTDVSGSIACFAVQGPNALELMQRLTGQDLSSLKRFHFIMAALEIDGRPKDIVSPSDGIWPGGPLGSWVMLSRTGYTGEDGFEVLCDAREAVPIWKLIINGGKRSGILPTGLGARDSLRLEMGYLLSGTDFDGSQSTAQTGPNWVVKLNHDFIGRAALMRDQGLELPRLTALILDDRGIPRHGYPLMSGGLEVGHITSGTLSPCLKKGIAMGYLEPGSTAPGTPLTVAIRDMRVPAHVVRPPFVRK